MPTSRSYADLLSSRPSSTALRRPLTVSSTTTPLQPGLTVAHHEASLSTSAIADSPRRLLSYYLSKAAFNTERDAVTPSPPLTNSAQDVEDSRVGDEEKRVTFREGADTVEKATELTTSPARLLRPPPFARSALSSGLRAKPSNSQPPVTPTSPDPLVSTSTSIPLATKSSASAGVTAAPFEDKGRTASSHPLSSSLTSYSSQQRAGEATRGEAVVQTSPVRPGDGSPAYLRKQEEQQQQQRFEAEVMRQVEALLQAQRSESYAELESYRVTAAEARATLCAVEAALTEQLGSGVAAAMTQPSESAVTSSARLDNAGRRPPSSSPPGPVKVESLALSMSQVAASAVPEATQELLDAIMNIQDGQDVPTALRHVVHRLFIELTRALVPPVMDFVTVLSQANSQSRPRFSDPTQGTTATENTEEMGGGDRQPLALLHAQAEIAALQDEVAALRGTLDSRAATGCVVPSSANSTRAATPAPSSDAVRHALQDRFFTECHAMLTRSRQESLALRRELEEERRQHFLTRIRLLKPAPPSLRGTAAGLARSTTTTTTNDLARNTTPRARSTTASQDARSVSSERRGTAPVAAFAAESGGNGEGQHIHSTSPQMPVSEGRGSPHYWTPARSSLQFGTNHLEEPDVDANESGSDDDRKGGSTFHRDGDLESFARSSFHPPQQVGAAAAAAAAHSRASQPRHDSALRVAEKVLRATGSRSTHAADDSSQHPYNAHQMGEIEKGAERVKHEEAEASRSAFTAHRLPHNNFDGPSVSFSRNADESYVSTGRSKMNEEGVVWRHRQPQDMPQRSSVANQIRVLHRSTNSSSLEAALPKSRDAVTSVLGERPDDAHEKRVWNKAVELLSRYSVT